MRRGLLPLATATALGCLSAASCVPARGGWDVRALEERIPAFSDAALHGHRLGDLAPHVLPDSVLASGDGAAPLGARFFLCRHDERRPVPLYVTPEAEAERGADIDVALRAWDDALDALRFERQGGPVGAGVSVELVDPGEVRGTGIAVADCRVDAQGALAPEPGGGTFERLDARLEHANVRMRSSAPDPLERILPLPREEFVGALLHELGHALGFGAHTAIHDDVLSASVDGARWAGRRALAGRGVRSSTLAALYAVPSGTVVGRGRLTPAAAELARRLSTIARERGWQGPYTRVGDRAGEVFWRAADGTRPALVVPRPDRRWPEPLVLVPNQAAFTALRER